MSSLAMPKSFAMRVLVCSFVKDDISAINDIIRAGDTRTFLPAAFSESAVNTFKENASKRCGSICFLLNIGTDYKMTYKSDLTFDTRIIILCA